MDDLTEIKERVKVINEELGETRDIVFEMRGEMRWIRWLLMGLLGAMIAQYFI